MMRAGTRLSSPTCCQVPAKFSCQIRERKLISLTVFAYFGQGVSTYYPFSISASRLINYPILFSHMLGGLATLARPLRPLRTLCLCSPHYSIYVNHRLRNRRHTSVILVIKSAACVKKNKRERFSCSEYNSLLPGA